MHVDVSTEITISRPRSEVAAFAADPAHVPLWYVNIQSVEWKTTPPARVGSQVAFVAHFLGRRLAYVYEITELLPGERLVMQTSQGPFPMATSYAWSDTPDGGTRMTLCNRGNPAGFSFWLVPLMAWMIRRENRKDLARLKALLENDPHRNP